jgi:hypothetical protein
MRRDRIVRFLPSFMAIAIGVAVSSSSRAQDDAGGYDAPTLSELLPPSVAQNLDLDAWGWLSYAPAIPHNRENYWDLDLALGATQRIGDRLAATADIHFIDSNGSPRGQLQQAFVTADLSEKTGTLLTVGKFNSPFGVEPRNAWDRLGGTTSLLFGAEPQDLLGVMFTQPLGDTRITARPFVVTDFQGRSNLQGPPSGGLMLEYRPSHELDFALTNWIGPGFTHEEEYAYSEADDEYASPSYDEVYTSSILQNWNGPDLHADRGGTLYFVDAKVNWLASPDLTLAAEGLLATDGPSAGTLGWGGAMLLANYDLTDRWRLFARWSFLDDLQGIVTGVAQHRYEISGGAAVEIYRGWELRGEYRHDFSDQTGDLDALSAHLTFSY